MKSVHAQMLEVKFIVEFDLTIIVIDRIKSVGVQLRKTKCIVYFDSLIKVIGQI